MNEHDEANLYKEIERLHGRNVGLESLLFSVLYSSTPEQIQRIQDEFQKHIEIGLFSLSGVSPNVQAAFTEFADSTLKRIRDKKI